MSRRDLQDGRRVRRTNIATARIVGALALAVVLGVAQPAAAAPVVSIQFQSHWRNEGVADPHPDLRSFRVRGPGVDTCVTPRYDPTRFVWPYWHVSLDKDATYAVSTFAAPGCQVPTASGDGTIDTRRAHNWFLSVGSPPAVIR